MKNRVFILFACCLLSCHNSSDTKAILNTAGALMADEPQKAKLLLETIAPAKLDRPSLKAKYALLYSQALDKNYIDKTDDSLISIAVEYFDRKGNNEEKALANYYHGRVYENAGDINNAIKSYMHSEQAVEGTDNYFLLGLINSNMANLYNTQNSLDDALERYLCSYDFFHKAGSIPNEALVSASIARTYYIKNKTDSADLWYNRASELFTSIGAYTDIINLNESLVLIQLERNENTDSIKSILHNCYSKINSGEIPITSLGLWQSIYLKENNLDSARICGLKILSTPELFTNIQIAGCLTQMGDIEHLAGNHKKAYEYSLQYNTVIDSVHLKKQKHLVKEIEQRYKNQSLKESNINLRVRQQYQNIIIILLIIILIGGSIFIGRAYIRWRRKVKLKLLWAHAEIKRLGSTYSELQTQYDAIKAKANTDDTQELRLFSALEERLNNLRILVENTQSSRPATFAKQFQQYMKVNVRSHTSLSELHYVVDRKFNGIVKYLEKNYPKLTKQDLDLCCLICFGFSQYGICYLYETELQTFYNKRHRLRERLGLKQHQKIEVFIQDLIKELGQE